MEVAPPEDDTLDSNDSSSARCQLLPYSAAAAFSRFRKLSNGFEIYVNALEVGHGDDKDTAKGSTDLPDLRMVREREIFLRAALQLLDKSAQKIPTGDPFAVTQSHIDVVQDSFRYGVLRKATRAGSLAGIAKRSLTPVWTPKLVFLRYGTFCYSDQLEDRFAKRKVIELSSNRCYCRPITLPCTEGNRVFELTEYGGTRRLWLTSSERERDEWVAAIRASMARSMDTDADGNNANNKLDFELSQLQAPPFGEYSSSPWGGRTEHSSNYQGASSNSSTTSAETTVVGAAAWYTADICTYHTLKRVFETMQSPDEFVRVVDRIRNGGISLRLPVFYIKSILQRQQTQIQLQGPSVFDHTISMMSPAAEHHKQAWKDMQRETLRINGTTVSGAEFGADAVVGCFIRVLIDKMKSLNAYFRSKGGKETAPTANISRIRLTEAAALAHARDILAMINRTQSGGDAYLCVESLFVKSASHSEICILTPSTAEPTPIELTIDVVEVQLSNVPRYSNIADVGLGLGLESESEATTVPSTVSTDLKNYLYQREGAAREYQQKEHTGERHQSRPRSSSAVFNVSSSSKTIGSIISCSSSNSSKSAQHANPPPQGRHSHRRTKSQQSQFGFDLDSDGNVRLCQPELVSGTIPINDGDDVCHSQTSAEAVPRRALKAQSRQLDLTFIDLDIGVAGTTAGVAQSVSSTAAIAMEAATRGEEFAPVDDLCVEGAAVELSRPVGYHGNNANLGDDNSVFSDLTSDTFGSRLRHGQNSDDKSDAVLMVPTDASHSTRLLPPRHPREANNNLSAATVAPAEQEEQGGQSKTLTAWGSLKSMAKGILSSHSSDKSILPTSKSFDNLSSILGASQSQSSQGPFPPSPQVCLRVVAKSASQFRLCDPNPSDESTATLASILAVFEQTFLLLSNNEPYINSDCQLYASDRVVTISVVDSAGSNS